MDNWLSFLGDWHLFADMSISVVTGAPDVDQDTVVPDELCFVGESYVWHKHYGRGAFGYFCFSRDVCLPLQRQYPDIRVDEVAAPLSAKCLRHVP